MLQLVILAAALLAAAAPSPGAAPAADPWLSDAPAAPDPALDALVARAMESSPILARARAAAEGGDARLLGARAAFLPSVGAAERFTSTDNPPLAFFSILNQGSFSPSTNANEPGVVNDWATNLYARYLLFDFGRRSAALDAARADAERLRLLEAAGRRDVRFAVTAAYHDLVRARAAVRLWEETVGLFARHERLAAAQHEAGAALRSDLLSVQVRLGEARERRLTAGHDAEIARTHLATAAGVPTAEVEVPERPVARPVYEGEETALVRDAREAHPTIAALDAAARAARAGERAAARGSLPTVGAEVRGEWHGRDEDPGVDRRSYFAAVVVDFPFFQGGRTLAARNEARARRREVEAARREAADALEEAARTAHRRALEAAARIQIADAAVGAARAALGIVEERYRAGMARIVDLLEAERDLTQARLRALDARAAAVIALAAVERVARREGE